MDSKYKIYSDIIGRVTPDAGVTLDEYLDECIYKCRILLEKASSWEETLELQGKIKAYKSLIKLRESCQDVLKRAKSNG